jgi:OmpR-family two-component system manganese-sensing response regulator
MAKILVVDDDKELTKALNEYLSLQNYVIEAVHTGEDALQLLNSFQYSVIILDWTLPGISGEQVCRTFRAGGGQTPIIFLTGKGDIATLETVLDAGADDYMRKPFNVRELGARVRALLRRRIHAFEPDIRIGDLVLNPNSNVLTAGDTELKLRNKEAAVLEYLMTHPNQVHSAQQLLDAVWSSEKDGTTNAVRTWMRLLRRRLATIGKEDLIKTVLGSGYVIESPHGDN